MYSTKKLPEGLARILHLVPCRFRVHLRLIVENLSKIKPKLRTQGRVTGNFGRNKVEGKRQSLELSKSTLSKENLRIPRRKDVCFNYRPKNEGVLEARTSEGKSPKNSATRTPASSYFRLLGGSEACTIILPPICHQFDPWRLRTAGFAFIFALQLVANWVKFIKLPMVTGFWQLSIFAIGNHLKFSRSTRDSSFSESFIQEI